MLRACGVAPVTRAVLCEYCVQPVMADWMVSALAVVLMATPYPVAELGCTPGARTITEPWLERLIEASGETALTPPAPT